MIRTEVVEIRREDNFDEYAEEVESDEVVEMVGGA
jgi:hypothetical protein